MSTTRRYTFKPANTGASIGHGPNRSLTGRYGQVVSLTDRAAYLTIQAHTGESGVCLVADVGDAAEKAASQAILGAIAGGATYAPEQPLSQTELAAVRAMDDADVEDLTAADITALQAMRAANVDDLAAADVSAIQSAGFGEGDAAAKAADVPSALTDLDDTPGTLGTAGQLLAVNGAADGLEFVDPSSGGGFPSGDWRAVDGVVTAFGDGASYPDLSVADGGTAAAGVAVAGGGKILRFKTNDTSTLVGRKLADISAGNFVAAVQMRTLLKGVDWNSTCYAGAFIAYWDGGSTSGGVNFYAVGPMRKTQDHDSGGLARINGTNRPALTSVASSVLAAGPRLGDEATYIIERVDTTLTMYADGVQVDSWTVGTGVGILGVVAAENDAGVEVHVEVTALADDGVFTGLPLIAADA